MCIAMLPNTVDTNWNGSGRRTWWLTTVIQPLDVSVNNTFKNNFIKQCAQGVVWWWQYVHSILKTEMTSNSTHMDCKSFQSIKIKKAVQSFTKCDVSNNFNRRLCANYRIKKSQEENTSVLSQK